MASLPQRRDCSYPSVAFMLRTSLETDEQKRHAALALANLHQCLQGRPVYLHESDIHPDCWAYWQAQAVLVAVMADQGARLYAKAEAQGVCFDALLELLERFQAGDIEACAVVANLNESLEGFAFALARKIVTAYLGSLPIQGLEAVLRDRYFREEASARAHVVP